MSKRIKDDELKELACYYNEEGKGSLYELLRDQYEIKNPYFVFQRMKNKEDLGYNPEQDHFQTESGLEDPDGIFMSMDELCSPMVPQHVMPEVFIVKLNYPKLQNKNGHCCKSKLDKVAKVVYRLSGTV